MVNPVRATRHGWHGKPPPTQPPPPPPPPTPQTIDAFTVNNSSITAGQSVTLTWKTSNAIAVRLNGIPVAPSGSQTFMPPVTTTYTLQADGSVATVSSSVAITVVPVVAPPTSANADFIARRSGAGVVRWHKFNAPTDPPSTFDKFPLAGSTDSRGPFWTSGTSPGCGYGFLNGAYNDANGVEQFYGPIIDTATKVSGSASARFEIHPLNGLPINSASAPEFKWAYSQTPFNARFGAGTKFYQQWRFRCDDNFLNTVLLDTTGAQLAGIKMLAFTRVPGSQAVTGSWPGTCMANQLLLSGYQNSHALTPSNSCDGSASHGKSAGMWETVVTGGVTDFLFQNENPTICSFRDLSGCFIYKANEWMTFKVLVDLTGATWNQTTNEWDNSEMKLWGANEGQPSVLLHWWRPGIGGYFPMTASNSLEQGVNSSGTLVTGWEQPFGTTSITNFLTNKSSTQVHPVMNSWLDELIVSTLDIPDPSSATGLAAMAPNAIKFLSVFNPQRAVGEPLPPFHVTDQAGMHYDAARQRFVLVGGGHAGTSNDGMQAFSMATLTWTTVYQPTPYADRLMVNYDGTRGCWLDPKLTNPGSVSSGPYPRYSSRHTEQASVVVGDQFIVFKYVDGNGAGDLFGDWWRVGPNGTPSDTLGPGNDEYSTRETCYKANSNGQIAICNLASGNYEWTFSGNSCIPASYPGGPETGDTGWPAVLYDEQSKLVWIVSRDAIWTYDPITKVRLNKAAVGLGAMGSAQAMVYYPRTDTYYYMVHAGGTTNSLGAFAFTINRTTGALAIRQVSVTGTFVTQQGTTQTQIAEKAWDYDAASGKIWMGPVINSGVISFVGFDPVTSAWTVAHPSNNTDAGFTPDILVYHCGRFDPVSGVWVWIDNSGRTWAWKPPS